MEKIPVGISSCLLGERVRYDGAHKQNRYIIDTLGQYFSFDSFCPEVSICLGIPRPTLRLVDDDGTIRCTNEAGDDVAEALAASATGQLDRLRALCGYIVKKDSPSCGMERVKVYRNTMPERRGEGRFTKALMEALPELPVEEEGRLGDPVLRENFIQRVFVYARWHRLQEQGIDRQGLTTFHARHKYILLSHDQRRARELGKLLGEGADTDVEMLAQDYIGQVMETLKIPATRANHVNVLQHIQGYLKRDLDAGDKKALVDSIDQYRLGQLPLIVPITLLRYFFQKYPNNYIEDSFYLTPHPSELMLLNQI